LTIVMFLLNPFRFLIREPLLVRRDVYLRFRTNHILNKYDGEMQEKSSQIAVVIYRTA